MQRLVAWQELGLQGMWLPGASMAALQCSAHVSEGMSLWERGHVAVGVRCQCEEFVKVVSRSAQQCTERAAPAQGSL